MHYLLKGIPPLFLLQFCFVELAAQTLDRVPISIRFGANELGGETNVAQLALDPRGQVIAAGEKIGYYLDGRWQFLAETFPKGVRCLFVDGDTLWVSGVNEIGRLSLPLTPNSRYEKLDLPWQKSSH